LIQLTQQTTKQQPTINTNQDTPDLLNMATDISTAQYPEATGPVHIVFSQPTMPTRWIERTTESRHMESLFLLADDAREIHMTQLVAVFPQFRNHDVVVRYSNFKMDQHYPEDEESIFDHGGRVKSRPRFGQLFRVETRFTAIGNTSARFQHRFVTVPKSQSKRDFNDRGQDELYATLEEDDEPPRVFASAEASIVFIEWQTSDNGSRFFKPTPGSFRHKYLAAPLVVQFLNPQAPAMRPPGTPRPANAFRVEIHLRKSDEDELGHVTNSRYVSLIHDVLTFGLRTGYYANGSGTSMTVTNLPMIASYETNIFNAEIAVPAGCTFYKRANVVELFIGYERELKVKPGVFVWSWVESKKIGDEFDVIRFEVCSTKKGKRGDCFHGLCYYPRGSSTAFISLKRNKGLYYIHFRRPATIPLQILYLDARNSATSFVKNVKV
jgi:acyl-CoA thioesterase FadM